MEKRGQIKGLWAVLGAVLALVIIAIFTYVIVLFAGLFTGPSAAEQGAVNNFDVLGKTINALLQDPSNFASKTIEFGFPDGYIIVGFDKDWKGDMEDDSFLGYDHGQIINGKAEANWCSDGEGIQKPTQCFGRACLCLYEETSIGDDFMEEDRNSEDVKKPCVVFNQDITISAFKDNPEPGDYSNDYPNTGARKYPFPVYGPSGSAYEFLVLYGGCDALYGIADLYVEKYVDESTGKIYVLAAQKTEAIEDREKNMQELFISKLYQKAFSFQQNKDYEKALGIYQNITTKYPESRYAQDSKKNIAEIAYTYDLERNFDKAIETYNIAHDLNAISSVSYWYILGGIYSINYYANKDYTKAVEYFKKVVDSSEAETTQKNNAKTSIKGICEVQQPTICLSLDAKYLQ